MAPVKNDTFEHKKTYYSRETSRSNEKSKKGVLQYKNNFEKTKIKVNIEFLKFIQKALYFKKHLITKSQHIWQIINSPAGQQLITRGTRAIIMLFFYYGVGLVTLQAIKVLTRTIVLVAGAVEAMPQIFLGSRKYSITYNYSNLFKAHFKKMFELPPVRSQIRRIERGLYELKPRILEQINAAYPYYLQLFSKAERYAYLNYPYAGPETAMRMVQHIRDGKKRRAELALYIKLFNRVRFLQGSSPNGQYPLNVPLNTGTLDKYRIYLLSENLPD